MLTSHPQMTWDLDSFLSEMNYYWHGIDRLRKLIKSDLQEAGFYQHTFKTNLQPKLDLLMKLLVGRIEMHSYARQNVEECLTRSGLIDLHPVKVNSLLNLAYLSVAQTSDFAVLRDMTRSHCVDYADCEDFLNQRNDLIRTLIDTGYMYDGTPYGGLCRDTIKGGLRRVQDGGVPRDVDLHFDSRQNVEEFISRLKSCPKFHLSKPTYNSGYGTGCCYRYRVFMSKDTTINVSLDVAYPDFLYQVDEDHAKESIDFNVNALVGHLHRKDMFYAVREGLHDVPGLTLPEILSDIEQKQFRAIGILMTKTPLSHKVFTDPTAHVCCHRYKSDAQKLRNRADALIARGWKLLTTCDDPKCWLGSKEKFQEQRRVEEERLRVEEEVLERVRVKQYLRYQEQLRLRIEEQEQKRRRHVIKEAEDSTSFVDHKARGTHRHQLAVKHKRSSP